jgi:predicted small secreted protein
MTKKSITKTIPLLLICGALLGACNTIEGAGKDVEKTGEAISGSSREVKKDM